MKSGISHMRRKRREEERRKEKRALDRRFESVTNRPRALTADFSGAPPEHSIKPRWFFPSKSKSGAQNQSLSPLFARLSTELRVLIYREVLCSNPAVHIHFIKDRLENYKWWKSRYSPPRLAFSPCEIEICSTTTGDHRYFGWDDERRAISCAVSEDSYPPQRANRKLLSLLLSCRAVYVEAIDMLYTGNTFYLTKFVDLVPLSRTLLPHRFRSIRSLVIRMTVDSYRAGYLLDQWMSMWNALLQINRRSKLHIYVHSSMSGSGHLDGPNEQFKQLMAPLKKVRCADIVLLPNTQRLANLLEEMNEGSYAVIRPRWFDQIPP